MNHHGWLSIAVFLSIAGVCVPAAAQMYRCGNSYQDRPCEAGQAGKLVGISATSSPMRKTASDSECAQRGANVQKIMWARESGATAENQLAEAKRSDERKLIRDVYQKRGTTPEVRSAIEADCVAEKERLIQAAALAAAAAKLSGQPTLPAEPPVPHLPNKSDTSAAEALARGEVLRRETKQKHCESLASQLEDIRRLQRAGATSEGMERLNQKRRDVEKTKGETGC